MSRKAKKARKEKREGFVARAARKARAAYDYCLDGVWNDPRDTLGVRTVKTLSLTMKAFFNSTLQVRSMALTYSTVLSIVPAFALIVAIGRGFGLQNLLESQIYQFFPSQSQSITTALKFVDSYLSNAKQGVFVGIGLVFLLWTVVSLLSSIENTFNSIWGVRHNRTFYQKITDYIAICLMVPVLLICSSGLSVFMSSVIQDHLNLPFLTPVVNWSLEIAAPLLLVWLAFSLSYYLIPNTKVNFKYAATGGVLAAISFEILQMLFLNGQIYVSKYNAIYGSFAFLPLMLVWLQLSWLVLLTGCMITYSMQNVFTFNLMGDESSISNRGWHNVALIVMAVATKRFARHEKPISEHQIAVEYYLPIRIVGRICEKMRKGGLIYDVNLGDDTHGISPAVEPGTLTVAGFMEKFDTQGVTDFIPEFGEIYEKLLSQVGPMTEKSYEAYGSLLVKDLELPTPESVRRIMIEETERRISEIEHAGGELDEEEEETDSGKG